MRFLGLLCAFSVVVGAGAGCGGGNGRAHRDGGNTIPDGFIQAGCATQSDCDDGDPCSDDICYNKECSHRPMNCQELDDSCNVGACNPDTGACEKQPANDKAVCTSTSSGVPGTCSSGYCEPAPTCYVDGYLYCGDSDKLSTSGTSAVDDYACVQGLTGPEYAYSFYASDNEDIKVTLTSTADLDLIVLEGEYCVGSATCVGTGGMTAGSGNETVDFQAKSGKSYTIVVDGRNGAKGDFEIKLQCINCKPVKTLECNTTFGGDTTSATATNNLDLSCASTTGPEEVYTVDVPQNTIYKITLSGAETEHDLMAFTDEDGTCGSAYYCDFSSQKDNPADDLIKLPSSDTDATLRYSLVVDARGTGGKYMLKVDCSPQCKAGLGALDCQTGLVTGRNDSPKGTSVINNYTGCAGADNETGPEVAYEFVPSVSGDYTFTLTGLDADLDLIVIEGDGSYYSATCDPASVCKASSLKTDLADESVTFTADSTKKYFILIDGKGGAKGNYKLKMTSNKCDAPSCYSGKVRDLDCNNLFDQRANDESYSSKNLIDTYECTADMTGNEVVYSLYISKTGTYSVKLESVETGLYLLGIKGDYSECDPSTSCLSVTNKTWTLNAKTADLYDYYYFVVDGKNGAHADYKITATIPGCDPGTCVDNYSAELSCDGYYAETKLDFRNDAPGTTRAVDTWSCSSQKYTGAESAHYLYADTSGNYQVTVTGLSADLDLFVLESDGYSCDPAAPCAKTPDGKNAISSTKNPDDGTSETVQFVVDSTKTYYIIVDGYNGAASDYTITMSPCPTP